MRTIRIVPVVGLCLTAFISSCSDDAPPEVKKQPPVVEGYVVKPKSLDNSIEVSGTLQAREETVLMPEISGRITMLNIEEGALVQKGTLLVKMFDADLQAQATRLRAELSSAKITADRLKQLYDVSGVSQQEYDIAATQVTMLEAEASLIAAQITKTEIRAPFTGVLGLRNVSEGAYVTAGTPIVTLREESKLKLDFSVPEIYAQRVAKSMKVLFTISSDTTLYEATVVATEQQVTTGSLNLHVRSEVQGNQKLIPGTSAQVKLILNVQDSAVVIPAQAIIPDVRYKKVMVSKGGKVEYVQVQTGARSATDVEIISGLHMGDTVITSGIQFLRPGASAKFSSVK
jgi:membrane fusion protein (multidrug efflux system)